MVEPLDVARYAFRLSFLVLLLVSTPAIGQESTAPEPASTSAEAERGPERATPRAAMFSFLEAMSRVDRDASAWDDAIACLDLSRVSPERGRQLAAELLGILNRIGKVEPGDLPNQPDHTEKGLSRFVYFPRTDADDRLADQLGVDEKIVLERGADEKWQFSENTVASISSIYAAFRDLDVRYGRDETTLSPALRLRSLLPSNLQSSRFVGLEAWQWLGIAIVLFLGFVVDLAFRTIGRFLSDRIAARVRATTSAETTRRAVRPVGLAASAILWLACIPLLDLPDLPLTVLLLAARTFFVLATTWALWRLTDLAAEAGSSMAAKTDTRVDDVLIPLLRKTLKGLVAVFGLIYVADSLRIEIGPLLAGLGIGGLAFAFAAKDTIENFFGSIAVLVDRPFVVGDWIRTGDVEGTVEELGFRSTRVRTFYNSLVTVPNATLVRATVDNYGLRQFRRFRTILSVQYDTPAEKIEAFCEGIRELVRAHPYTRKDSFHVYLNDFGPSSLDVLLYVFFVTPDWATELRERHRLSVDVVRLADRLGVSFAFPTRTVHLFHEDAAAEHRPAGPPERTTDRDSRRSGAEAARALTAAQPWRERRPGPVSVVSSGEFDDAAE